MSAPRRPDKPGGRPSAASRPRTGSKPARPRTEDGTGERKARPERPGRDGAEKPVKGPRIRKDGSVASGRTQDRRARADGKPVTSRDDQRPGRPSSRRDDGARPARTSRARDETDAAAGRPEERRSRVGWAKAAPREDRPGRSRRAGGHRADTTRSERPSRGRDEATGRAEERPSRTGSPRGGPRDDRPARPARPGARRDEDMRPAKASRTRDEGNAARGRAEERPARTGRTRPIAPQDGRPAPTERPLARPGTRKPDAANVERAKPEKTPRVRKDGSLAVRTVPDEGHSRREPQRIAKLLARAGVASRREIERMIEDRRIALNGAVLETPATILTSLAGVTVDGQPVAAADATRLFLFHKPAGFLTAERDFSGRPTIYDRLPEDMPRVVPVGRLDMNTEGLLLLTNDGELKRKLELPSTGIPRIYRARAYGEIGQEELEALSEGIEIDGMRYGPIDANMERRTGRNLWIEMKLTEGKNREVRNVLEYLGLQVSRLIRVAYGPFILADLPAGEVGEVKQHELVEFRKTLK